MEWGRDGGKQILYCWRREKESTEEGENTFKYLILLIENSLEDLELVFLSCCNKKAYENKF